jgi:hypothetical protein
VGAIGAGFLVCRHVRRRLRIYGRTIGTVSSRGTARVDVVALEAVPSFLFVTLFVYEFEETGYAFEERLFLRCTHGPTRGGNEGSTKDSNRTPFEQSTVVP